VNLYRSDLERASGATVNGDIDERDNFFTVGAGVIFTALAWVGLKVAVILAGLVFAAVGARQLTTAARNLTEKSATRSLPP
jgi:Flp pilus assembly protein TadB